MVGVLSLGHWLPVCWYWFSRRCSHWSVVWRPRLTPRWMVDDVNNSLAYYIALKKAKVPVEMHLYAQGGHAYGLRRTQLPITEWRRLVETWLGTIGIL